MKKVLCFAVFIVLMSATVAFAQDGFYQIRPGAGGYNVIGPDGVTRIQPNGNGGYFIQGPPQNYQQQQPQRPNGYIPSSELKMFHVVPNRNGEHVY